MLHYIVKLVISASLIVIISEAAKRYSVFGALIASLPIVSILAICWLYWDTGNVEKVSALSRNIFWLVIPSLVFFISLPCLLRYQLNFYLALLISIITTVVAYGLLWSLLTKIGVKL